MSIYIQQFPSESIAVRCRPASISVEKHVLILSRSAGRSSGTLLEPHSGNSKVLHRIRVSTHAKGGTSWNEKNCRIVCAGRFDPSATVFRSPSGRQGKPRPTFPRREVSAGYTVPGTETASPLRTGGSACAKSRHARGSECGLSWIVWTMPETGPRSASRMHPCEGPTGSCPSRTGRRPDWRGPFRSPYLFLIPSLLIRAVKVDRLTLAWRAAAAMFHFISSIRDRM